MNLYSENNQRGQLWPKQSKLIRGLVGDKVVAIEYGPVLVKPCKSEPGL